MGRFLGGRFGDAVPVNPGNPAGTGIYTLNDQYYISQEGGWLQPFSASGGTEFTPGNGYRYHIFTSDQNFVAYGGGNIDYILVGGGGAGRTIDGSYAGGAGGAGGYIEKTAQPVSGGTYPIVIGAGGALNSDGGDTTAFSLTAVGGGYGGKGNAPGNGNAGGSGGGGSGSGSGGAGSGYGTPTQQGYPGGGGNAGGGMGGGGGGAGAAGSLAAPPSTGTPGGDGKSAWTGDNGIPVSYGTPGPTPGRWFAGGGGGGTWTTYGTGGGQGGAGGGGNGAFNTTVGTNGAANTGGGGGGSSNPGGQNGTTGGSGIVIIRYPI